MGLLGLRSSAPVRSAVAITPQISELECEDGVWARLVPIFRRLDALLAQAVEAARLRFGEEAATDPYRGLHITPDQVERSLAIAPGIPLLFRGAPSKGESDPARRRRLRYFAMCLGSKTSTSTRS